MNYCAKRYSLSCMECHDAGELAHVKKENGTSQAFFQPRDVSSRVTMAWSEMVAGFFFFFFGGEGGFGEGRGGEGWVCSLSDPW